MKINNKGFTLVEVLAVVVIISVLVAIMAPNINNLIVNQKRNSKEETKNSVKSAARMYISDNKYEITVNGTCNTPDMKLNVSKSGEINNSVITVKKLIELGLLKTKSNDPLNNNNNNYVLIKYDCRKKDLIIDKVNIE